MSINQTHIDHKLLQDLSKGSNEAFTLLYDKYHDMLHRFVIKFIKSPDLADDITQEVFMQLWENRTTIMGIRSLKPWLFTLAKNRTFNVLKRAAIDDTAKSEILKYYQISHNATETDLVTKEYLTFIKKVLDTLPPQSAKVFQLCREENKSYEEVAAILGISRNAVKKHMVRSMKVLKGAVEKDLGISLTLLLTLLYHH